MTTIASVLEYAVVIKSDYTVDTYGVREENAFLI